MKRDNEKDISTKQYKKSTDSWFQGQNALCRGYKGLETEKSERAKTVDGIIYGPDCLKREC